MARSKPIILVLMGGYWPRHEATGPNQNLKHMLSALADDFTFKVVARDRPPGAPIASAPCDSWVDQETAQVRYCPVSLYGARGLATILRSTPHDVLALNGFFDREFTIPTLLLRRLGLVPKMPTILSVHGEMGAGALSLKSGRKQTYLAFSRQTGLLRDVWMHATSEHEANDIAVQRLATRGLLRAPNLCRLVSPARISANTGQGGHGIRLVFVGRIARVKNLGFAIDVLREVHTPVTFEIFGPVVEPDYWSAIQEQIVRLPPHIRVHHRGEIANDDVPDRIAGADAFFLPTLGENFGHAIFEALSCGVPVLISDRTPWRNLEDQSAGWSLPLDKPQAFVSAVERLAAISSQERAVFSAGARALAERFVATSGSIAAARRMFETVLSQDAATYSVDASRPMAAE